MGPEEQFPVNFWGIAGVLFKRMDKVAFRTETKVVGNFHKGIFRVFQQVFSCLNPLLDNIFGQTGSYLFMKQAGQIGGT